MVVCTSIFPETSWGWIVKLVLSLFLSLSLSLCARTSTPANVGWRGQLIGHRPVLAIALCVKSHFEGRPGVISRGVISRDVSHSMAQKHGMHLVKIWHMSLKSLLMQEMIRENLLDSVRSKQDKVASHVYSSRICKYSTNTKTHKRTSHCFLQMSWANLLCKRGTERGKAGT